MPTVKEVKIIKGVDEHVDAHVLSDKIGIGLADGHYIGVRKADSAWVADDKKILFEGDIDATELISTDPSNAIALGSDDLLFVPVTASVPDFLNRAVKLSADGTWTVDADGYIQRLANVTHPSTPYAGFSLTVNGVTAWATEYAGLLSTGLYTYTSPPIGVKKGDVIGTTSNGNGIASTLFWMPPIPIPLSSDHTPGLTAKLVEYDLTSQLDGITQEFIIPNEVTSESFIVLYYGGQRQQRGKNYTVDFVNHKITTLFPKAPDNLKNRGLVLEAINY